MLRRTRALALGRQRFSPLAPTAREKITMFPVEGGVCGSRAADDALECQLHLRPAAEKAKLGRVLPHMLRHSCGYYLADQGTDLRTMQDYLGHRDPKHTAHYTRVAGHRFEGLWR
jgi:integrase